MEHDTLVEGVMIPLQDCSHSQVNSVHDGILEHAREKEVRITNSYISNRDGAGSLC